MAEASITFKLKLTYIQCVQAGYRKNVVLLQMWLIFIALIMARVNMVLKYIVVNDGPRLAWNIL